jgi:NSS family neurotransmitter:Na+ symporter
MTFWTVLTSAIGFGVCSLGVQKGVERVTKFMMSGLLVIILGLAIYAITLDGASKGLRFYLKPDFARAAESGIWALVNDAMNQAFFTLSIGIGSMTIFGSYLKKDRTLTSESLIIVCLDTLVALVAGLIIFPACFAFGVNPGAGPGLIFVTLPNVFNSMGPVAGRVFGAMFFVFMSAAALTTVIAVVENCIAYFMDTFGWTRARSTSFNFVLLTLLTLPCILGFNVWSAFGVPRIGCVMDCEDFIVSNNILPLGSLLFCLFCTSHHGWGWRNFTAEADAGEGLRFPRFLRFYLTWILPALLFTVFIIGYMQKFGKCAQ